MKTFDGMIPPTPDDAGGLGDILAGTLTIVLLIALGVCLGVTGAFWIDRQLYPMEITD